MRLKKIIRLFHSGNVAVFGECGSGKDILCANIACREKSYISNVVYDDKNKHIPLDITKINIPNDYDNFNSGKINKYIYPYPENIDIFFSDLQTIFPSDFDNQLCKKYPGIPTFWQLHRHLANNRLHWNTQNLRRVWVKIREHSTSYIMCVRTKVILGIVFERIRIYNKYQSAEDKVLPFRFPVRMKSKDLRKLVQIEKAKFINQYGIIKSRLLIYRNKSKYDSRFYKKVLERGSWCYD